MDRRVVIGIVVAVGVVAAGWVGLTYFAPEKAVVVDEAAPAAIASAPPMKSGSFSGADRAHNVEGTVTVFETEGGSFLRFEDYDATNGPDVYLYLTKTRDPESTREVEEEGLLLLVPGTDEGRATKRGTFTVPVPDGVDLSAYNAVAAWCDRFNVLFGHANLDAS